MRDNYFLDTNTLKYLISNEELKKHNQIKEFIINKNCEISTQNLKELSNILFKKTNLSINEIKEYISTIGKKFTLCLELPTDVLTAINISKNRKNFYAALLVATMKRNGITKIITENEKDFNDFKGIKVINPFN